MNKSNLREAKSVEDGILTKDLHIVLLLHKPLAFLNQQQCSVSFYLYVSIAFISTTILSLFCFNDTYCAVFHDDPFV